jgi:hypothetical protein
MGYYSTIEETPKINKPVEFNKALAEEKEKGIDSGYNWQNFWVDNIKLEGTINTLDFEEYHFKAYEIEDFVKWLNQFEPQGDLILLGEEGELYGFRFRDGKILELQSEIKYIEVKEI